MMNNKGQSLVLFILLLPILLGIMALVIDCGNAYLVKNHTEQVIELYVELVDEKKITVNEMEMLLKENLEGQNIRVVVDKDNVNVESSIYLEGIFTKLFKIRGFKIKSEYSGNIKE